MMAAIIQVRMSSTRLPGKVLKTVVGKTLLGHIVERLKFSSAIDRIIIATTVNPLDTSIIEFCTKNKIDFFVGSEFDVLDRYYNAAKKFKANTIVRITSDNPLVDPLVVDKVTLYYKENSDKYDFVSNTLTRTYPVGLDVEVFSFEALETAWKESTNAFEREHVTPYMANNPLKFRLANVIDNVDHSDLRWTMDYPEDFNFVKAVYESLYEKNHLFLMNDVLTLLSEKPDIRLLNKHIHGKDTLKEAMNRLNSSNNLP
jgi:spore coat polysaccharide biosynthesis protein SpsF